jgi:transcription antitermination factor NusG
MPIPQWHALIVRPQFERIVAIHLQEQKIQHYLPLLHSSRHSTKDTDQPLFPGYVFCKCDAPEKLWTIPGVLSIRRGTSDIQAVLDREITDVRRILAAGLKVQLWPFTPGGRVVTIDQGPLSGLVGNLEDKGAKRFLVFPMRLVHQSVALKADSLPELHFAS